MFASPVQIIKEIADSGVKVIIAGSSVGELTLHYLDRMSIVVVKVLSKFDLRRLCRVVNATHSRAWARLHPRRRASSTCWSASRSVAIGLRSCVSIRTRSAPAARPTAKGPACRRSCCGVPRRTPWTISSAAVDDGVNVLKALLKDTRLVSGAGATELELARRVEAYGSGLKGLSQHAVKKFATALEVVHGRWRRTRWAGPEGNEVLGKLWAKHNDAQDGGSAWGVDVEVRAPLLGSCVSSC